MSQRRSDSAGAPAPAGAAYRATTRLTDKPGKVLALPGETCEHVPELALVWLGQQGLVVPAACSCTWPDPAVTNPPQPAPADPACPVHRAEKGRA